MDALNKKVATSQGTAKLGNLVIELNFKGQQSTGINKHFNGYIEPSFFKRTDK